MSSSMRAAVVAPAMSIEVDRHRAGGAGRSRDFVAVEEPLEIRINYRARIVRKERSIAVTMRTPGHDSELAAGFLFTEGLLRDPSDVLAIRPCRSGNRVRVVLRDDVAFDAARMKRHFFANSSCGVCGKASIDAVRVCRRIELTDQLDVNAATIRLLPERLRNAQAVFEHTGGLHGCALFSADGELRCVREDVGRHNAVDKLIGRQFLIGKTPLTDAVLLLSGRISFELVQKAAMAGIPLVAAIGAPSSLAVQLAEEVGMTLVGFLREDRFNVYTGGRRLAASTELPA
ncbi:MAG TPA: formate dehydrogenase accessory sulfurtransferase FdhD [Caulifigura sp.]|nr:formate dehydrogenase accessory sulfurtransferase FdhD [Caulifigura sp.]